MEISDHIASFTYEPIGSVPTVII